MVYTFANNTLQDHKNLFLNHQKFFMNKIQIEKYVEVNKVEELFSDSFKSIIENNTCKELDIKNKNISLDLNNVEYVFKNTTLISCKSKIYDDQSEIGYYSVVLNDFGKIGDDFFVIF